MFKTDSTAPHWVTKKLQEWKVLKTEDQEIARSTSEIDLKIDAFNFLSVSCVQMSRICDLYHTRLLNLATEEKTVGRLIAQPLVDHHPQQQQQQQQPRDQRQRHLANAILSMGSSRLKLCPIMSRFSMELSTFKKHAIEDVRATIVEMERHRGAYRGALTAMKSIGDALDPDSGRGLQQYRAVQFQVKQTKRVFDKAERACCEKIELLTAARCNMFSTILFAYQTALETFLQETTTTFEIALREFEQPEVVSAVVVTKENEKDKEKPKAGAAATAVEDEKPLVEIPNNEESVGAEKNPAESGTSWLQELEQIFQTKGQLNQTQDWRAQDDLLLDLDVGTAQQRS